MTNEKRVASLEISSKLFQEQFQNDVLRFQNLDRRVTDLNETKHLAKSKSFITDLDRSH